MLGLDRALRCTTHVYITKDVHIHTRPSHLAYTHNIFFNGPKVKENQLLQQQKEVSPGGGNAVLEELVTNIK